MPHNKRNQFRASAEINFIRSSSADSFGRRAIKNKSNNEWWTHLRRGLVIEPSARHQKQMKQAVWLYLYFLLNADAGDGTLFRRLSTVSKDTGIPARTVRRWFGILRKYNYIKAEYNGHFWQISVNKWRPISRYSKRRAGWLNRMKNTLFAGSVHN